MVSLSRLSSVQALEKEKRLWHSSLSSVWKCRYARSGLCCGSHLANHSRAGQECSASSGESGRQSPIRQISSRSVSGAGVTLKLTSQPGASLTESPLSFLHHWGNEPMVHTREAPSVVHPIAERAGRPVGKSTFAPPYPCSLLVALWSPLPQAT